MYPKFKDYCTELVINVWFERKPSHSRYEMQRLELFCLSLSSVYKILYVSSLSIGSFSHFLGSKLSYAHRLQGHQTASSVNICLVERNSAGIFLAKCHLEFS